MTVLRSRLPPFIKPRVTLLRSSLWRPNISKALVLDLLERAVVLALFAYFMHRMLPRLTELMLIEGAYPQLFTVAATVNAQIFLIMLSEALVAFLIVIRPASAHVSGSPSDWALSFLAASLPLFVAPAPTGRLIPADVVGAIIGAGLLIQIAAKISLWRSFGVVPANHGVKTGGPYALVRHPMYSGYVVTQIGFLLGFPSLQNALLYLATFGLQIIRIVREETILRTDPHYERYARRVRCRLLPVLY